MSANMINNKARKSAMKVRCWTLNFRNLKISIKVQSMESYKLQKRLEIYKISLSISIKQKVLSLPVHFQINLSGTQRSTSKASRSLRNTGQMTALILVIVEITNRISDHQLILSPLLILFSMDLLKLLEVTSIQFIIE